MTQVTGRLRKPRTLTVDSFADITDAPVVNIGPAESDPTLTTVEFDGDLTDDQIAAVCNRMDSTDSDDEAKRAVLRADRDALDEDDPLRRLYDHVLEAS